MNTRFMLPIGLIFFMVGFRKSAFRVIADDSYPHRIITSMQVLQEFCYYLSLCGTIFLSHCTIHELYYVSVKVSYEVLQILSMSCRIQPFSTNPFHCVSVYDTNRTIDT